MPIQHLSFYRRDDEKLEEIERVKEEMLAKAAEHGRVFRKNFLQQAGIDWLDMNRAIICPGPQAFFQWNDADPARSRAGVDQTLSWPNKNWGRDYVVARTDTEGVTTIFYGIGKKLTVRQDGNGGLMQEDVVEAARTLNSYTLDRRYKPIDWSRN